MRRSAMVASHPWTLVFLLEDDPDSLGCWLRVQELTMDGGTADAWDRFYPRLDAAFHDVEISYGIGPNDWTELE